MLWQALPYTGPRPVARHPRPTSWLSTYVAAPVDRIVAIFGSKLAHCRRRAVACCPECLPDCSKVVVTLFTPTERHGLSAVLPACSLPHCFAGGTRCGGLQAGMRAHWSQYVWFRKLFIVFSRYVYVNTYQWIEV